MSMYAVPRRPDAPPKTLGTLNILFGIVALCWGLCNDSFLMLFPKGMQAIGQQTAQTQKMIDTKQERAIEALKEQEAEAKTQAEKDDLRKQEARLRVRKVVVTTPQNEMLTKMKVDDPRYFVHYGTALATGLILNTALIVAGVGLLRLRPWGRTLSLWVAGLQLVRLVAITTTLILIVGPVWARMSEGMTSATGGVGIDPAVIRDMHEMNRTINIATQIGLFILGSIYPIVTLWLLNTRSSLAALGLAKAPEPPPMEDWPEVGPAPAAKIPPELVGVLPDPKGPRRIGIVGIIIALFLFLSCNMPQVIFASFLPIFTRMTQSMEKVAAKAIDDERARDLEEARAKEKEAKTEAERFEAHAELQALESSPKPPVPPMSMLYDAMNDAHVRPYLWVDALTGLALNVAMFVGAIGLVQLREWGRKTMTWVAAFKIMRIIVALVLGVGIVMPALGQAMADNLMRFISQLPAGPRGGPNPAEMRKVMTIVWTSSLVVVELLALIWPVIVLWVLSRPRARAACLVSVRGGRDLS